MASVPPPLAVDAALALRRALLRAADALLPPWAAVWEKSMGVGRTQVLAAIADLGLADALAETGPATAAELAPRVGAEADTLHRLLRVAAVDGIVRLDRRGRFRLTRMGRTLRADSPASLKAWASYMGLASTRDAWGDLTESVRSGQAAFPRVHGRSVWAHFADHPEEERLFAGAMRSVTELDAPVLAALPVWPERGTVCDVAGGAGTLLGEILATHPGLQGVLVEGRGVLAEARDHLGGRGLAERAELVEGDLFGEISAQADVYVLKNVLHDWDDATSARILAAVRAAMAPGTRLVLIEQVQQRNRPHPFASYTDLQMLTQTDDGRERSPDELRALLRGAGLVPNAGLLRAGVSGVVVATAP